MARALASLDWEDSEESLPYDAIENERLER